MKLKGVIDRIEGERAIILIDPDEQEYSVPLEKLPEGASQGSWLEVILENSEIYSLVILPEETEQSRQRIAEKMSLLRARGSSLHRENNNRKDK